MKPEFIDNRDGRTLVAALTDLAATPGGARAALDIATAYFNLSGFLAVADVIESRPAFRLLLGAEPESPLSAERDGASGPLGLGTKRSLEGLEDALASERDALPFTRRAAEDVVRLARLLGRDEVEVRRYLRE